MDHRRKRKHVIDDDDDIHEYDTSHPTNPVLIRGIANKELIKMGNQNTYIGTMTAQSVVDANFKITEAQRILDKKHTLSIMNSIRKHKEHFICDSIVLVVINGPTSQFEIVDGQHRNEALVNLNKSNEMPHNLRLSVLIHVVENEYAKNKYFKILSKSKPIDDRMVFQTNEQREKVSYAINRLASEFPTTYSNDSILRRPKFNDYLIVSLIRKFNFHTSPNTYDCIMKLNDKLKAKGEAEISSTFKLKKSTLLACHHDKFYLGVVQIDNVEHLQYLDNIMK